MKKRCNRVFVVLLVLAVSFFGCSGQQGSAGSSGSAGAQGPAGSPGPSGAATVASLVDYYTINDGSQFIRSLVPFSVPTGNSGTALQMDNSDGSVTLTINNSPAYADCGFYIFVGMLGDLNSIKITTTSGSDPIGVNIWFDKDSNGEFFTWTGTVYGSVAGDAYILGPQSTNNVLSLNTGSIFTSLNPGGGSYTLAQLIGGAAPGITITTRIAIWTGISVNSGSSTATIQSLTIN
ncbi:MAG TPA: hypothetical protein VMM54_14150 [Nitrospirota bacterium]|nr:hypothetical protein [Nitrospirota bacterium]